MQSRQRLSLNDVRFEMQGSSRTLGMNVNWIKLPDSEVGEVLIVGSDITGKKRAEDELRSFVEIFDLRRSCGTTGQTTCCYDMYSARSTIPSGFCNG
jgi:hypothetical protein